MRILDLLKTTFGKEPRPDSYESSGTASSISTESNSLKVITCAFACCPPGTTGFLGGEDTLGWNLLLQVARFSHVWVLTDKENESSIEQVLAQEKFSNIHPIYVGLPSLMRNLKQIQGGIQLYYFLWQIKAYFAARKHHKTNNFDIFHHITYANDWMQSFTGAFLSIPYIRGPGGGSHRTPNGLDQEYTRSGRYWERMRRIGQWFFRHDPVFIIGQARSSAILVCIQESVSKMPRQWVKKTQIFPVNGISNDDLSVANRKSHRSDTFQVLTAGSLIRVKGFGLAVKSFGKFVEKYPDSELKIIGSGPEESHLREIISNLNLKSQIKLIPAIPRDHLLSEMAACDVFLFPSLRDGGGAVVVEAMAAGKPTVCLDTGGPGLHIDETCGIKISPLSSEFVIEELAGALERLYLDEGLRRSLGKSARRRAESTYRWDHLGDRLIEVYKTALHR